MSFLEELKKKNSQPANFYRVSDVFVPGGQPSVTYVQRESASLDTAIEDWYQSRYKVLHVTGPTKSGKTVVVNSVLGDRSIQIAGGSVKTEEDFWLRVCEKLELSLEKYLSTSETNGVEDSIGIKTLLTTAFKKVQSVKANTETRFARSPKGAALEALEELPYALVVDDFHYIPLEVQASLIRALKDPVFKGARIVLLSVPHREFDAARAEKEMVGRLENLQINAWDEEDLREIARLGFEALGCTDPEGQVAATLSREAFGNPLLMQEFCKRLCSELEIVDSSTPKVLSIPSNAEFYRDFARSAEKAAFKMLFRGPSQRQDRKLRRFQDGRQGDIYKCVLAAVAETGPKTELTYEDLRASLRSLLVTEDVPQKNEVTNVLQSITKICKEKIDGEPIVDYDRALNTLYISDPYFAFYLRWARDEFE